MNDESIIWKASGGKIVIEEYYEIFARPPKKSTIRPFELNREGGRGFALVLRYAGCNLRCPLCYAWRYAWFPQKEGHAYNKTRVLNALEKLNSLELPQKINWIRIQGGEPCLTLSRTLLTLEICSKALQIIHDTGLNNYQNTRAIIQTNGIFFANLNKKHIEIIRGKLERALESLSKGRVVLEFSFKDPTGKRKVNDKVLLELQIKGFRVALNEIIKPLWDNGFEYIALYPVAGLGPSIDLHNITIVPINPYSLPDEYPLFHPETWSHKFKLLYNEFLETIVPSYEAYRNFRNNVKTNQGKKIPLEEFEPTRFQVAWISGYAGKYQDYGLCIGKDLPQISRVLRRLSSQLDKQWLGLCKIRKDRIKKEWLKVLECIPVAHNPTKLRDLVEEMDKRFYPSHPKGHYPYL